MDEKKRLKMAIIAGASHALKQKSKDFKITDDQVLKQVSKEADDILRNIDLS